MVTYSNILAWRIPWIKEPGGLYSPWGHKELDMTDGLSTANTCSVCVCVYNLYMVACSFTYYTHTHTHTHMSFPGSSAGKNICLQCRRPQFNSWVGKIPWRMDRLPTLVFLGFRGASDSKESTCNARDLCSISRLRRTPGGGHGNPLQYSSLEKSHGQRSLAGYSP